MRGLVLSLAVLSSCPVLGSRFKAREKVRVVAQAEGRPVKTVVATATGVFTARFADVSVRACMAYIVRATGSKGSYAYLRHLPACPGD